jgi:oligopeptide/dipeptide ABC transporter ATP-binding protein
MTATSILSARDVVIEFATPNGTLRAVDGVSFDVPLGSLLGVVGESGSGKSVLMRSITGIVQRSNLTRRTGSIMFEEQDLIELDERGLRDVRGSQIAMIFQDPMTALNPVMTIGHQIGASLRWHQKLSRKDARRRTLELLDDVRMPDRERRIDDYAVQLSGGLRQRVMIAIALSCEPSLLIADEPTTALDVTVQAQILNLLEDLRRERSMSVILVTHDLGIVAEHADEVIVMYAGRVAERGTSADLFEQPRMPYTRGLLDSIPHLEDDRSVPLVGIPGAPPSLLDMPSGCAFEPRCSRRSDRCVTERPPLEPDPHTSQSFACWHPLDAPTLVDHR